MAFVGAGVCAGRRAHQYGTLRGETSACRMSANDQDTQPCDIPTTTRRQLLRNGLAVVVGIAAGQKVVDQATSNALLGSWTDVPHVFAAEEKKQAGKLTFVDTESGLAYAEVKKGSGPMPHDGDLVIVNYVAYLSDGTIFDNTTVPGRKPLAFQMGQKKIIPGLEEALRTMQPGGKRKVIVPPKLAYGSRGVCFGEEGCLVPPNSVLEYDLELVRVAVSPT